MRASTIAVLLLAVCSISLCQAPWTYCPGSDGSKISVSSCPIVPFPIVKGKPVIFEVVGTAKVAISQKNARIDVYTSGTKIFTSNVGSSYSTGAGQGYDYKFGYSIPSFVPAGSYEIHISMIDTSGNSLGCVLVNMNF